MIIGIDGNEANVSQKVGIGEYAFSLLAEFKELHPLHSNIKFQIYLKNEPLDHMPREDSDWQYRVIGPRKLWTQVALPIELYRSFPRPNVFFSPSHYAPRFSPVPCVISVMDLSYIFYPMLFKASDLYQLKNWTSYSVSKAKRIMTISKSSKNDIIKVYKIPEERVVVTYPGFTPRKKPAHDSMDVLKKYEIVGEYILFVGTLQPRKNIVRLVEAFSILKKDKKLAKKQLQLVIIGKKGWLFNEILQSPKEFHVEDSVRFLHYIPDEELGTFYKEAKCFVLPSLYEGFGLPVLEAMSYGCPVITSNVSSLPEAGGEAALYIDPMDADDIAAKIKMVLEDELLRQSLIEKGKEQVKKFSWKKTAEQTLAVLEEVAHK